MPFPLDEVARTAAGPGAPLGDLWARVTAQQPAPSVAVVAGTAAAVLVCLTMPTLWRTVRHAVTIVHEASHALVAVLVGRRLSGIRVHADTSGLTVTRGRPTGPGVVAMFAAGYPGPALVGLGAAALVARGYAAGTLWLAVVVLAGVLLMIRNWYGLWAVAATAAVVVPVTLWASPQVQLAAAHAIAWLLLLGAPRAVLELAAGRRGRRGARDTSDAGRLAALTHVPAALWVGAFLLVTVGTLAWGARWLVAGIGR